ncbi:MAG TPA: DUF4279 domain-containing protein [Ignavibacteria bacterium]|nr:DUF4279 domain-containing protein [Ignavibacteria bacterium]
MNYDGNYSTCEKTDSLLRISSGKITPDEISKILNISPTEIRIKGELRNASNPKSINKVHCWYLGSKDFIKSKDSRRHLDWIIEKVHPSKKGFRKLQNMGAEIDICCLWESSENQGGPIMEPEQMGLLSDLGIPVWWEFWYCYDDEKSA